MKTVDHVVAIAVAFLFVLGTIVLRSTDHVQVAIELLKVIIAWPPIFLFLALLFMRRYPNEIRSFLSRAIKVGPLEAQQLPPVKPEEPAPKALPADALPTEEAPERMGKAEADEEGEGQAEPSSAHGSTLSEQQPAPQEEPGTVEVPRELLRYLAHDREGWKFQFLNQFLVHNTKSVLDWFAQRAAASLEEYDRTWRFSIPEPEQRARVVDALLQYGLLKFGQNGLEITDEGRRALEYFVQHWPVAFTRPSPMPLGATGATGVGPTGPTGPIPGNLGFGPPSALESLRRVAAEYNAKPPEPGSFLEAFIKKQEEKKKAAQSAERNAAPEGKGLLSDK